MSVIKTGEMFTMVLDNPRAEFARVRTGTVYRFDIRGTLVLEHDGEFLAYDTITASEDWELVREPVDFMTAINSGKNIKSHLSESFHTADWYIGNYHPCLAEINGKWLIE